MQTRIVTRPAIAAMALVIAWTASPRAGLAQQCRRTCESGETRDVRGCCVPMAAPAPRPAPKPEGPPREAPEAEAPAAKPSAPPAAKPSEPRTPGKSEQPRRVRRQRDSDPAPTRPATSEPARPVPAVPPHDEQPPRARTTPRAPAPEPPTTTQPPRTGQPPGATAPRNLRTEPPGTARTEPIAPSRPDTDRPADARPTTLAPPRAGLTPGAPVAEQEPRRRWPVWMPWAVVGTGAVVTGVGGILYTTAAGEYDSFDEEFDYHCPGADGCFGEEIPQELRGRLDRARLLENVSRVPLIVGGVTVAAGAALVFLNQTKTPPGERITVRSFVVPTLGPDAAGIAAGISF